MAWTWNKNHTTIEDQQYTSYIVRDDNGILVANISCSTFPRGKAKEYAERIVAGVNRNG